MSIHKQNNVPKVGHIKDGQAAAYDFSISAVIREGWSRVSGFKCTMLGAILYYVLIVIGVNIISSIITQLSSYVYGPGEITNIIHIVVNVLVWIALFPMLVGLYMIGIRRAADQTTKASMVFSYYRNIFPLIRIFITLFIIFFVLIFLSAFLFGVAHTLPMGILSFVMFAVAVLISLLSIYLVYCYIFAPILLVEKKLGVWQSLKISRKAVSQHWFKIFFMSIITTIFIVLSCIPLFIGLIWSLPWAYCVRGVVYRIIFGVEK